MSEKNTLNYKDYLQLDKLLDAQALQSEKTLGKPAHHEMFFIIVHQAYELWFKQILFELTAVIAAILKLDKNSKTLPQVLNGLDRIHKIQLLLNQQITVLETLSPTDFLTFRDLLTPASGFQSHQFRLYEIQLGMYHNEAIDQKPFYSHLDANQQSLLQEALKKTSLYQALETWLKIYSDDALSFFQEYKKEVQEKLAKAQEKLNGTTAKKGQLQDIQLEQLNAMIEAFKEIFAKENYQAQIVSGERRLDYQSYLSALYLYINQNDNQLSQAFQVLKYVIEIDEALANWRAQHALMVQRMIGNKIGTGGTSGYRYLQHVIKKSKLFSEFAELSGYLIPEAYLTY